MEAAEARKEWLVRLMLLATGIVYYFFHLHQILLNANSILSSVTLDSIKNYYTFVYHSSQDTHLLEFRGMNYPFYEHVVYSDCQPLLTFVLRPFSFLQPYLIGIMHTLLIGSYMVTPLVLFTVLRRAGCDRVIAFCSSFAITLLTPQYLKITAGHHALAYAVIIPLNILLVQNLLSAKNKNGPALLNLLYNLAVFLIHPYLGFCLSVFSLFAITFRWLVSSERLLKNFLVQVLMGVLPIILFRLFMALTDHHAGRTNEPFGNAVMIENFSSLFAPDFGPFQSFLEKFAGEKPFHFEGHSYLGIMVWVLLVTFSVLLIVKFRVMKFRDPLTAMFLSSLLILFISFGYHNRLLELLNIKISAISQFRAVCRFAWVFYFTAPLFFIVKINEALNSYDIKPYLKRLPALLYLCINLVEAPAMIHLNESAFWHFRNFFNESLLNEDEKKIIAEIKNNKPQCILPLPMFHGGSEMYDRNGSSQSMSSSYLFSAHTGVPILSVMMSRTSIPETEAMVDLLNSYKKDHPALKDMKKDRLLVIKNNDPLLPDEERLHSKINYFKTSDSLSFAFISLSQFLEKKTKSCKVSLGASADNLKKQNILYIPNADRPPFTIGKMSDYEKLAEIKSNELQPGRYILSFYYHCPRHNYRELATDLIIAQEKDGHSEWIRNIPVRKLSGFYNGFAVFEDFVEIRKNARYEFLLKGLEDRTYKISSFILHPDTCDVFINNQTGLVYNNYPEK